MPSCVSGAPEERGWGTATDAIALVRPRVIVGLHERLETALQGGPTGEVAATKGHAPMFLQDRALEPFDEAVGPGMPRLRPSMAQAQCAAGLIERAFELRAAVGEHAAPPPAGSAVEREHDPTQEVGGSFGRVRREQPGHPPSLFLVTSVNTIPTQDSLVRAVRDPVSQMPLNSGERLPVVNLESPPDLWLEGRTVRREVLPFVLVAYGLSVLASPIPMVETPDEIPPMPPTEPTLAQLSHEDIYVD